MPSFHHFGLRVADADRASDFYCEALGGLRLTRPVLLEGAAADGVVPGGRLRVALIGFGDAAVELFEVLDEPVPPVTSRLPHLALQVDDVPATLARAEAAGGERLWPEVGRFGRTTVIYLTDPDGNVLELLDGPAADIASAFLKWFPEADPS